MTANSAPEYSRTSVDFQTLAKKLEIPFAEGAPIGNHFEFLNSAKADIAVSINYTGVISQNVIDLFPLGILNAHGGDLPRYRGNACQAWAILNGEKRIGLCIHRMVGGELDSGDILAKSYLPIDNTTKVSAVWDWMVRATPALMVESVNRLAADPGYVLERQSKDQKDALRCYPRRPEDGRINWDRTALDVLRLINASNKPYAGAYCEYEGRRMTIWDAALLEDGEVFYAVPGQVTRVAQGHVEVACGSGKLIIRKVQRDGDVESAPSLYISSIRKRLT
ncbi:MAG TPA: formyltransferase family protein [Polaromonas sp.]|uniref:methionyl-tRNA formyltransferase n=1 Tax=Polaromonas sp. TaxID=1869339 RepID=UPI002D74B2DC|nr:formyltransferase family protein [Polaromonas sp.]HYW56851.1 formyltransferase family protein [Polaromonas sp.]